MNNYDPQEIKLANELAETLNDRDAFQLYCSFARKYQESFLRRILAKVMSIPEIKIRRTRGALFTFLVNQGNNHEGARD